MKHSIVVALGLVGLATPTVAQDIGDAEIIVTGSRIAQDDYDDNMPAIGLRRTADFLIQPVTVSGDTRDAEARSREIYAMLREALKLAGKHNVQLAFGDFVVQPLTSENLEDLTLSDDRRRPDTELTTFLIKAPLAGKQAASAAQQQIARFIDAVPEVGRAQMDAEDDPTFSVVAPDSYRNQIVGMIGEDAQKLAAGLGDGYAVEIEGLNMPVQWTRSGVDEVFLYIPYRLVIVPKP